MSVKYHDVNVGVTLGGGGGTPSIGLNFNGGFYLSRGVISGDEIGHFDNHSDSYFSAADSTGAIVKLNTSQPFEFGFIVNFSDSSQVVALCGQVNSSSWGAGNRAPSIVPSNSGAYCAFAFPGTSGWATILNPLPSGYTLPNNKDIFFKMAWDGSTCSALIDDGTNAMTASGAVSSLYYNSSNYMVFATQGRYAAAVPRWSVYKLDKLYYKQNGTLIWGQE